MRLLRRFAADLPHGPTSAGGVAQLTLAVPSDTAASRRREALVLYAVTFGLMGLIGVLDLGRRGPDLNTLATFVLSSLALAGAIAAWLKHLQAGMGFRGALTVLIGLAWLSLPWLTSHRSWSRWYSFDRWHVSFTAAFWGLLILFAVAAVFCVGLAIRQRVVPAILTLPLALVFINHTSHGTAFDRAHRGWCAFAHDTDSGTRVIAAVAFGLCVAYALYAAKISSTGLRPVTSSAGYRPAPEATHSSSASTDRDRASSRSPQPVHT